MEVGYHHTLDAMLRQYPKGKKFDTIQPFHIMPYDGQIEMRIHIRIPVPRKMFGTSHHITILKTLCIHVTFYGNIQAIFPERAGINYGIIGVVIHIRHRSKIDMYPKPAKFSGNLPPHLINQSIILNSSQHQLLRVTDGVFLKTHAQSPLRIHRNHQGYFFSQFLIAVRQFRLLFRCALKKTKPTNMELLDNGFHFCNMICSKIRMCSNHEKLAQPLLFG